MNDVGISCRFWGLWVGDLVGVRVMMPSRIFGVLFSLIVLFFGGCNSDYPQTYSVNGTVTLEGEPLPNVIVTFIPEGGGQSATGTGDEQGNFRLSTFAPNDGALEGPYKVAIIPKDPPPMPGDAVSSPGGAEAGGGKYTPPFPSRYGLPDSSGFTASVEKGGENTFTFDLKNR